MLEVLRFILKCVVDFISMLFTIDVGNGLSLGLIMCVIFIFLPLVLIVSNFLKFVVVNEIDERYDSSSRENKYIGKHEYVGKHSREYFKRRR